MEGGQIPGWRSMAGHQQAVHDPAGDYVLFHDLRDVRLRSSPIPHTFRIDDDAWTILAVIETSGLIGANDAFETQPAYFHFHKFLESNRATIGAAPARVALGTLVNAHKDMTAEIRHVKPKLPDEFPASG